jgi:hypothetical protein
MEKWHIGLVKLVLFDIWRDLLLLKYGSEGVNIGINTRPYSYTAPDVVEGSAGSAGNAQSRHLSSVYWTPSSG